MVYHLCSRLFYALIGQPNNRNRRKRSPAGIKRKLMQLDFVLENPGYRYLATEREKLGYFVGTWGIDPMHLPGRIYRSKTSDAETRRFFVDKFPIYIASENGPSDALSPHNFCYVDPGATTVAGRGTYLHQYRSLLRRLASWRIVYVSDTDRLFEAAVRCYAQFSKTMDSEEIALSKRLVEYFRLEHLYETEKFDLFDKDRLVQLARGRRAFKNHPWNSLYISWQREGDQAVLEKLAATKLAGTRNMFFAPVRLRQRYDLFGVL